MWNHDNSYFFFPFSNVSPKFSTKHVEFFSCLSRHSLQFLERLSTRSSSSFVSYAYCQWYLPIIPNQIVLLKILQRYTFLLRSIKFPPHIPRLSFFESWIIPKPWPILSQKHSILNLLSPVCLITTPVAWKQDLRY